MHMRARPRINAQKPKTRIIRLLGRRRHIDTQIPALHLAQILEQEAPLEVGIRMQNSVELTGRPKIPVLDLFQFILVARLEDAVTRNVEPLLGHVLSDALEDLSVRDAGALQQRDEVLGRKGAVGAAVGLAARRGGFGQEFLARVGRVAFASAVCVAADVAVGVADVVRVFFFELFWQEEKGLVSLGGSR